MYPVYPVYPCVIVCFSLSTPGVAMAEQSRQSEKKELSHLDEQGKARMVDVGEKDVTRRTAEAEAILQVSGETLKLITEGRMPKGDVFSVARIAGIQAAKRTSEWIPLAHPLPVESVEIDFDITDNGAIRVRSRASVTAKTGVEMEALVAVSAAALTLYDMCKSVERGIVIEQIRLLRKSGGRSGEYTAT